MDYAPGIEDIEVLVRIVQAGAWYSREKGAAGEGYKVCERSNWKRGENSFDGR